MSPKKNTPKNTRKESRALFIRQTLAVCILMMGLLSAMSAVTVLAQQSDPNNALPLTPTATTFGNDVVQDPGGTTIVESLANLVGGVHAGDGGIVGRLRGILAALAIAMTIYSGLKMIIAQGEEGKVTSAKQGIYMGLIGLAIISLAGEYTKILSVNKDAAKAVFQGDNVLCQYSNTILGGGSGSMGNELLCRVNFFNSTVKMVITFLKYIISALSVYEIISNGYRIITLGGEPGDLERDKKNLIWGAVGLMVIIFSEGLISKVFYQLNFKTYSPLTGVQPKIDISEGVRQLVAFTNVSVSILGPIAILILIGASVMYMTSGGDEDKQSTAKRAIFAAAAGVLIIYGAFGIVSTVISGNFQG